MCDILVHIFMGVVTELQKVNNSTELLVQLFPEPDVIHLRVHDSLDDPCVI